MKEFIIAVPFWYGRTIGWDEFLTGHRRFRMGSIMVVQSVQSKNDAIDYVHIPTKIPKEVIENDSLLVLEKSLNRLEDRVLITARTVLGINDELKNQIDEIDRVEKVIITIHEFLVHQHLKIEDLEAQLNELKQKNIESPSKNGDRYRFWKRIFSK